MVRSLISAAVLSLSLTVAFEASAAEWVPKAQGSRVVGEIDWWPTDDFHVVGMGVAAQIRLHPVVYLDIDVPWGIVSPDRGDALFAFGNPTVGAHWADMITEKLAVYAGGSLTVATMITGRDTVLDGDYSDRFFTRVFSTATRAYADFHRFLPDYMFLRGRGGLELQILPVLYYRVELAPMVAIPIGEFADDAEFLLDIHNEIEARGRSGVGGGLHLQAVINSGEVGSRDDVTQLAVEPYFVYDPGRGFYARVGSLVALDEPLGFGFKEGKMAAFRVSLGGRW
ncbi:MAG: hypothetical protein HUU21_03400 [Polyangiaceae bacterium]|nr:hypothetical protein [Polyangiaceae bacterium]